MTLTPEELQEVAAVQHVARQFSRTNVGISLSRHQFAEKLEAAVCELMRNHGRTAKLDDLLTPVEIELFKAGRKIAVIKSVRGRLPFDLKDAKEFVDKWSEDHLDELPRSSWTPKQRVARPLPGTCRSYTISRWIPYVGMNSPDDNEATTSIDGVPVCAKCAESIQDGVEDDD